MESKNNHVFTLNWFNLTVENIFLVLNIMSVDFDTFFRKQDLMSSVNIS